MFHAALASLASFSVADQNLAFFVLTMLSVWIVWLLSARDNKPAPRIVINTILLLVLGIAGIEMLRSGVGVASFAVFAALLLIVKMLDLREPRDASQVLVLTVAMVIAAILTSNTLITGVFMIVACVLLMRAVLLYQLYWATFQSEESNSQIDQSVRVDVRSILLATGFLCAILGTLVFIVLPRNLGSQAFGQWGQSSGSVSGFSDTVELDRSGLISSSPVPVLDLTITDRDGQNIGSEHTPAIYLRGAVLYDYKSGDWRNSLSMQNPLTSRTRLTPPETTLKPRNRRQDTTWDRQFNISMRSSKSGQVYLFAPWRTVEFKVGSEPMRLGLDFSRGIFVKDGIGGKLEYSVRATGTGVGSGVASLDEGRSTVTPTEIEPEIRELAERILLDSGVEPDPIERDIREDQAAIGLFERHLRSQYSYSLDSLPVPQGQDATSWFLFDRQAGHCEYFASALALMSRSVGIPARVITGYIVSDFNSVTGQYVVRESNAHAWVEAEVAPGIWKTYDGTPRADFHAIHEPDPSLLRSLTKFYESIEYIWVRSVVGYDSVSRESFLGGNSNDFGLTKFADKLMRRFAIGRDQLIIHGFVIAGIAFSISMFVGILLLKYRSVFQSIRDRLAAFIEQLRGKGAQKRALRRGDHLALMEHLLHQRFDQLEISKPDWKPLKEHISDHTVTIDALAETTKQAIFEASSLLYQYKFTPDPGLPDQTLIDKLENRLRESEKLSNDSK